MIPYRREIDGLRALAVVPVILFHTGIEIFNGGFVGVDVFFVISGYLITQIIKAELSSGTFSFLHFYERRARRILPILLLVMLVCLPFSWQWLLPSDLKSFSANLISALALTSNLMLWLTTSYFDQTAHFKPLIHTWSLSVEEQYYLIFPALLFALKSSSSRVVGIILSLVAAASLISAEWLLDHRTAFTFYMLPTRAWELLMGAILAWTLNPQKENQHPAWIHESIAFFGLLCITIPMAFYTPQTPFPGLFAIAPTLGSVAVIACANRQTLVGRCLGNPMLVGVGLISYGAYLWHQPILAFARHRALGALGTWELLGLALLSLPMAYISWVMVEKPFRRKDQVSTRVFLWSCSIGFMVLMVYGISGWITQGQPQRFSAKEQLILEQASYQYHHVQNTQRYPTPETAKILGNDQNIVGVLLGDSHAQSFAYALDQELQKHGLGLINLTSSGCYPVLDVYSNFSGPECSIFNQQNFSYVASAKNIQYIVIISRWTAPIVGTPYNNEEGGSEEFPQPLKLYLKQSNLIQEITEKDDRSDYLQKINATFESLAISKKKVIIVAPVPEAGWNVPVAMVQSLHFQEKSTMSPADFSTSYSLFQKRNGTAIDFINQISKKPSFTVIQPDKYICNQEISGRCVTHHEQRPLYFDDDHLSAYGASLIAPDIVASIRSMD